MINNKSCLIITSKIEVKSIIIELNDVVKDIGEWWEKNSNNVITGIYEIDAATYGRMISKPRRMLYTSPAFHPEEPKPIVPVAIPAGAELKKK